MLAICMTLSDNVSNKRYFKELEDTSEDDPIRGDDEEPNDDQGGELDFPPEDLFHQDEVDVEITLNQNAGKYV